MGPGPTGGLSASAGGGGPSGASSNAGVLNPFDIPFNFDHSGWIVNVNSSGATLTASGNKDANRSTQNLDRGTGVGAALTGALGGAFSGNLLPLLLGAAGLYLLVRRK